MQLPAVNSVQFVKLCAQCVTQCVQFVTHCAQYVTQFVTEYVTQFVTECSCVESVSSCSLPQGRAGGTKGGGAA